MRRSLWCCFAFACLFAAAVRAQAPAQPAFEVASVKANKSGAAASTIGFEPGGRFHAVNEPVWRLIAEAYRTNYQLREFDIIGMSGDLARDRFDVEAVPNGSSPPAAERQAMLQRLLAERFKLLAHRERREQPIFYLVRAQSSGKLGPQLHPSTVDCAELRRSGRTPPPATDQTRPCVMMFGQSLLRANGMTLTDLAETGLSRYVERAVIDRTELKGPFEWTLEWASESNQKGDATDVSIFTAVQEQLGLKLEAAKGPVDVLVIDHVEHPTED